MKKLLICILCFASVRGFAQFRLGVQGSLSSINVWQTDGYTGVPANEFTWQLNSFQAGLVAEYDLGYSGVVLQPALMYAGNGAHLGQNQGFVPVGNYNVGYSDTKLQYYSLRLPLNILYMYRVSPKVKVFGGLGPYVAYTLSGTEKGHSQGYTVTNGSFAYETMPIDNKVKISTDPSAAYAGTSNVAPIDIGMDILLGFQYRKLQVSASWNRGFSRMYHTSYVNLGNQFWNFTLGYMLWGHDRKPKL
jgi:hypothetical protein